MAERRELRPRPHPHGRAGRRPSRRSCTDAGKGRRRRRRVPPLREHLPRLLTDVAFDGNFLDAGPLRAGRGRWAAPLRRGGHSGLAAARGASREGWEEATGARAGARAAAERDLTRKPSSRRSRFSSRRAPGFDFGARRPLPMGAGLRRGHKPCREATPPPSPELAGPPAGPSASDAAGGAPACAPGTSGHAGALGGATRAIARLFPEAGWRLRRPVGPGVSAEGRG